MISNFDAKIRRLDLNDSEFYQYGRYKCLELEGRFDNCILNLQRLIKT